MNIYENPEIRAGLQRAFPKAYVNSSSRSSSTLRGTPISGYRASKPRKS
jgi:hypothetical protein